MNKSEIPILLVGYKRLDLLRRNIETFLPVINDSSKLYVSIDGIAGVDEGNLIQNQITDFQQFIKEINSACIEVRNLERNFGCDQHIPNAIDWVLKENKGVIVIEDDIQISTEMICEIRAALHREIISTRNYPVISLSGVSSTATRLNLWRNTNYFCAWGYALSAEFWEIHKETQKQLNQISDIDEFLNKTKPWQSFSKRKKTIWRERLMRGNYDYKIQATIFKRSMKVQAPLFRISDNIGYATLSATHTRHRKPAYLNRKVSNLHQEFRGQISNRFLSALLVLIDANTWAGDGLLTSRGRVTGIRTKLKRMLHNFRSLGRQ
jgi:hypothetical protein